MILCQLRPVTCDISLCSWRIAQDPLDQDTIELPTVTSRSESAAAQLGVFLVLVSDVGTHHRHHRAIGKATIADRQHDTLRRDRTLMHMHAQHLRAWAATTQPVISSQSIHEACPSSRGSLLTPLLPSNNHCGINPLRDLRCQRRQQVTSPPVMSRNPLRFLSAAALKKLICGVLDDSRWRS